MVLVLHDTLVDPSTANSARAFLSKGQSALRVLSRAQELAEVFFLSVLIEWREHVQVQEILVADVFDGMDVDLVRRPRRPDLGIPHTRALGRADRPEELLNRTAPPQGPDDEGLHQVAHPGTVRLRRDSRPA